jgi:hypothetical protein
VDDWKRSRVLSTAALLNFRFVSAMRHQTAAKMRRANREWHLGRTFESYQECPQDWCLELAASETRKIRSCAGGCHQVVREQVHNPVKTK